MISPIITWRGVTNASNQKRKSDRKKEEGETDSARRKIKRKEIIVLSVNAG